MWTATSDTGTVPISVLSESAPNAHLIAIITMEHGVASTTNAINRAIGSQINAQTDTSIATIAIRGVGGPIARSVTARPP